MPASIDNATTRATSATNAPTQRAVYQGNDKLLFGIILGVLTFWLFAQTTLNVAPDMQKDLGLDASIMNIAVALTALFSGIFIVVLGGLADRVGRLRIVKIGFFLSIAGSLLIALAPSGAFASAFLFAGRALQGLSGACIMPASLALVKTFWMGLPANARSASGRSAHGAAPAFARSSAAWSRRISAGDIFSLPQSSPLSSVS